MPRHPRLLIPGATYHVDCRVALRELVTLARPTSTDEADDATMRNVAPLRMGSVDFSADFERLDQALAAGRRVGGKNA